MKSYLFWICAAAIFLCGLCAAPSMRAADLNLLPQPRAVKQTGGAAFVVTRRTRIIVSSALGGKDFQGAQMLATEIERWTGWQPKITVARTMPGGSGIIYIGSVADDSKLRSALEKQGLAIDKNFDEQGYAIAATRQEILIGGASAQGTFYGVQTLRQLLRPANMDATNGAEENKNADQYRKENGKDSGKRQRGIDLSYGRDSRLARDEVARRQHGYQPRAHPDAEIHGEADSRPCGVQVEHVRAVHGGRVHRPRESDFRAARCVDDRRNHSAGRLRAEILRDDYTGARNLWPSSQRVAVRHLQPARRNSARLGADAHAAGIIRPARENDRGDGAHFQRPVFSYWRGRDIRVGPRTNETTDRREGPGPGLSGPHRQARRNAEAVSQADDVLGGHCRKIPAIASHAAERFNRGDLDIWQRGLVRRAARSVSQCWFADFCFAGNQQLAAFVSRI